MKRRMIAAALAAVLLTGCAPHTAPTATEPSNTAAPVETSALSWSEMVPERQLDVRYATEFTVDCYEGGYSRITMAGTDQFLVVPENAPVPTGLPGDLVVLQQPLDHIYQVSSAVMDLFRGLDSLDAIRLSGTRAEDWFIPEARQAMEDGKILYAGKYSAPDYELILSEGCDLVVENTMIFHSPDVKEQLESLGIPVLVDRSSYEADPLARMEWLKLYGVLLGKEAEAAAFFADLEAKLEPVLEQEPTNKSVGFFFITGNGAVNVRKPTDYITRCIRMAGGTYILDDLDLGDDTGATATTTIQMEQFYASAKDADVLIYNGSTTSELQTMDALLELSPLLSGCKAVQEGNVWSTGNNLYQDTLGLGQLILEIHQVLTAEDPDALNLQYLHKLH